MRLAPLFSVGRTKKKKCLVRSFNDGRHQRGGLFRFEDNLKNAEKRWSIIARRRVDIFLAPRGRKIGGTLRLLSRCRTSG